MSSQAPATIENLCRVAGKAELVDGQIVSIAPGGGWQGHAVGNILASLSAHSNKAGVGHPVGGNAAFVVDLPHRKSFSPDAAFYTGELTMKFLEGAPVFAVEVRSEGDYGPQAEAAMAQKRSDYFAAGTLVVWDVDLLGKDVVRVYRSDLPEQPTIYGRDDIADAEPAVSGWSMPVQDMLPPGEPS